MDYGFRRERQPWEAADGAANAVAELAAVDSKAALGLLPLVADVALLDHWPQARALQTTICQLLPEIMGRVGKQVGDRNHDHVLHCDGWGVSMD